MRLMSRFASHRTFEDADISVTEIKRQCGCSRRTSSGQTWKTSLRNLSIVLGNYKSEAFDCRLFLFSRLDCVIFSHTPTHTNGATVCVSLIRVSRRENTVVFVDWTPHPQQDYKTRGGRGGQNYNFNFSSQLGDLKTSRQMEPIVGQILAAISQRG